MTAIRNLPAGRGLLLEQADARWPVAATAQTVMEARQQSVPLMKEKQKEGCPEDAAQNIGEPVRSRIDAR